MFGDKFTFGWSKNGKKKIAHSTRSRFFRSNHYSHLEYMSAPQNNSPQ